MSKILLADWSANFAIDHEHEKLRVKEKSNESTSLNSSLNLGSEEMFVKEYVQLAKEEIVDVKNTMTKLVDLEWGREIHLDLNLNEEPMEGNDVDYQPTTIVKLPQALGMPNYYQNFAVEYPLDFSR